MGPDPKHRRKTIQQVAIRPRRLRLVNQFQRGFLWPKRVGNANGNRINGKLETFPTGHRSSSRTRINDSRWNFLKIATGNEKASLCKAGKILTTRTFRNPARLNIAMLTNVSAPE